jgi:hypothetical protein
MDTAEAGPPGYCFTGGYLFYGKEVNCSICPNGVPENRSYFTDERRFV